MPDYGFHGPTLTGRVAYVHSVYSNPTVAVQIDLGGKMAGEQLTKIPPNRNYAAGIGFRLGELTHPGGVGTVTG